LNLHDGDDNQTYIYLDEFQHASKKINTETEVYMDIDDNDQIKDKLSISDISAEVSNTTVSSSNENENERKINDIMKHRELLILKTQLSKLTILSLFQVVNE
jgi:hypothetical protein